MKRWFVAKDKVEALTVTANPTVYLKKMNQHDSETSKGWGQIITPLSVETAGGRQKLNCANTQEIFRLIQSMPSPKVEPFKRWVAKVSEQLFGISE